MFLKMRGHDTLHISGAVLWLQVIILYNVRQTEDEVRDLFIQRSGNSPVSTEKSKITERIAVRLYENDSDHDFCGLGVDEDDDVDIL